LEKGKEKGKKEIVGGRALFFFETSGLFIGQGHISLLISFSLGYVNIKQSSSAVCSCRQYEDQEVIDLCHNKDAVQFDGTLLCTPLVMLTCRWRSLKKWATFFFHNHSCPWFPKS
jgi:hypothetical protein